MNDYQTILEKEKKYLVQTYKRAPFLLTRGEGVLLYDSEGKTYFDWTAGIAVNALGYQDPVHLHAIAEAGKELLHVSNVYLTAPMVELAEVLVQTSFADKVFFCNSGTEANEGAIKFARKVHYERGDASRKEIVHFSNAFHGRTMGALALTPREKYQKPFTPLMPETKELPFNDIAQAMAGITEKTAGVIVEPVQGEGGVQLATVEFLKALRERCDQTGAVLIFDEIQCGVGRTGTLWAHEQLGATPDIMTLAKPLAGGLPIGAILVREFVAASLHVGEHGTTFAGGPFITKVAKAVFDTIREREFLAHVQSMGEYLRTKLRAIKNPVIKEVRGLGLINAVELTCESAPVIERAYGEGLLIVGAGSHVLRLVPPLIVTKEDIDVLAQRLEKVLKEFI